MTWHLMGISSFIASLKHVEPTSLRLQDENARNVKTCHNCIPIDSIDAMRSTEDDKHSNAATRNRWRSIAFVLDRTKGSTTEPAVEESWVTVKVVEISTDFEDQILSPGVMVKSWSSDMTKSAEFAHLVPGISTCRGPPDGLRRFVRFGQHLEVKRLLVSLPGVTSQTLVTLSGQHLSSSLRRKRCTPLCRVAEDSEQKYLRLPSLFLHALLIFACQVVEVLREQRYQAARSCSHSHWWGSRPRWVGEGTGCDWVKPWDTNHLTPSWLRLVMSHESSRALEGLLVTRFTAHRTTSKLLPSKSPLMYFFGTCVRRLSLRQTSCWRRDSKISTRSWTSWTKSQGRWSDTRSDALAVRQIDEGYEGNEGWWRFAVLAFASFHQLHPWIGSAYYYILLRRTLNAYTLSLLLSSARFTLTSALFPLYLSLLCFKRRLAARWHHPDSWNQACGVFFL